MLTGAYSFLLEAAGVNYTVQPWDIPIPQGTDWLLLYSQQSLTPSPRNTDDLFYNPNMNPNLGCPFERSAPNPFLMRYGQHQQFMDITGWLDASWLYGSTGYSIYDTPFSWNDLREGKY